MFDELKVLKKQQNIFFDTTSDNSASMDYNTILEKVISIYKVILNDSEAVVTAETAIELSDDQYKQFQSEICSQFNINCEPEDMENFGKTIGDVAYFVLDHTNDSIESLLETQVWDSRAFNELKKKCDITLRMLNDYGVSEEGIGTGLLKVFVGTADLFLKVGNTFKTNIFKFYKSLKRSELRFYWESHMLLCKTVEGRPFTDFMNMNVPIPSGMVSGYKDAIDYVDGVYQTVDLKNYGEAIYKELMDIRRQLTRGQEIYKQGFKGTAQSAKLKEDQVRKCIANQSKFFSDKQTSEMAFGKAFKSMQDLNSCRGKLLDMEKYLGETDAMVKLVDNIDMVIGDITNYLTEDSEVDKGFIEQLAQTIRFLATAFDIYGTHALRQMALEHNLILTYENLYKKI